MVSIPHPKLSKVKGLSTEMVFWDNKRNEVIEKTVVEVILKYIIAWEFDIWTRLFHFSRDTQRW